MNTLRIIATCFLAQLVSDVVLGESSMSALTASHVAQREEAAVAIRNERGQRIRDLIEFTRKAPDRTEWHDGKHLAILLLGDLRAVEAVPLLVENILYRNPRTLYMMGPLNESGMFPGVEALVKIGMPAIDPVVAKLGPVGEEDQLRRNGCWIVREVLGNRLAQARMQIAIEEAKDPTTRKNLEASLAYLRTLHERLGGDLPPPPMPRFGAPLAEPPALSAKPATATVHAEVSALSWPKLELREEAAAAIRNEREQLIRELIAVARQASGPSEWHDGKYLAILLLGDYRATEAAPLLVENILYRNPRSLDEDERTTASGVCYPAADALAKIGMPAIDPVIAKLGSVAEENQQRRNCCWIIREVLGERLGRAKLQIAIEEAKDAAVKQNLAACLPDFRTLEEKLNDERIRREKAHLPVDGRVVPSPPAPSP
jgi:hypothetical protein